MAELAYAAASRAALLWVQLHRAYQDSVVGEAWEKVPDFPYAVSTLGRVMRVKSGRILPVKNGWVTLCRGGRVFKYKVGGLPQPQRRTGRRGNFKHGLTVGIPKGKPDPFFTIYALIDPRDFSPFYIGCTKYRNGDTRLTSHPRRGQSTAGDTQKMRDVCAAGLRPYFGVLETTNDANREAWHIRETARLGFMLVNDKLAPGRFRTLSPSLSSVDHDLVVGTSGFLS